MRYLCCIALVAIFSGCTVYLMEESASQQLDMVAADKARVVFLRGSTLGGYYTSALYDVTEQEPVFIGLLTSDSKLTYQSPPGERVFMIVGESADFMEANLLEGKTYYSIATIRFGAWHPRFSLWPVRNDGTTKYHIGSPQFKIWMQDTVLLVNTPAAREWNQKNLEQVREKQARYWPIWQQKSPTDLANRTLNSHDGI